MRIKKELILSLLSFVLVLQVQSQNVLKTLDTKAFRANVGSTCEETTDGYDCASIEIYLTLEFHKKKVTITEIDISSCDEESISYQLEYEWEIANYNEIKIHYKAEDVKYKSIENMRFEIIDKIIFGYKTSSNNKIIEYKFINYQKI